MIDFEILPTALPPLFSVPHRRGRGPLDRARLPLASFLKRRAGLKLRGSEGPRSLRCGTENSLPIIRQKPRANARGFQPVALALSEGNLFFVRHGARCIANFLGSRARIDEHARRGDGWVGHRCDS